MMASIHIPPNDQKPPTPPLGNVSCSLDCFLLSGSDRMFRGLWENWTMVNGRASCIICCTVSVWWASVELIWNNLWDWTISTSSFQIVLDAEFWGKCNRCFLKGWITWATWLHWYLVLLFFLKTYKLLKVIHTYLYIFIDPSMECVVCTSQLKMIFLYYV